MGGCEIDGWVEGQNLEVVFKVKFLPTVLLRDFNVHFNVSGCRIKTHISFDDIVLITFWADEVECHYDFCTKSNYEIFLCGKKIVLFVCGVLAVY